MTDCQQLLADYGQTRSERAFRELVASYLDLVYSTALRMVDGDSHRAKDVAQIVFADLARKAGDLGPGVMLGGWLHRHTCFVSANTMRGERRRRAREREAAEMNALHENAGADFSRLAPLLDEAINQLDDTDRAAILLRFFEQNDFRAVGRSLDASEDAARMRVNRALDKLRDWLTRRGISTTTAALSTIISANAVQSAPAGLAGTISAAVLAGTGAVSISAAITSTNIVAMTTLQKIVIGTAFVAAIGTGIYEAHQARQMRDQNQSLRRRMIQLLAENERLSARTSRAPTPRLPAPPIQGSPATNAFAPGNNDPTNFWAGIKDRDARLTREQADSFLKANGRNAANLLAAYRTSHDATLLEEAMRRYPDNPEVAFEAAEATTLHSLNLTPEEQRQWLDAFEKSAPNNSLANYLSAINYFNAGKTDEGLNELSAASGKTLEDYTTSRAENDIEAFLAAGYSPAEAEQFGTSQLLLPHLAQLKNLTQQISDLASAYRQTGDTASAQAVLLMGDSLGQQFANPSPGEPTITQLVGIAIENIALRAMDPNTPYGDNGQTVQDRLNELAQQRAKVQQMSDQVGSLLPLMTPQDLIAYKNRWLMFGEENAQQWVISKYGQQ